MKKLAAMLVMLLVIGSVPGFCLIATIDNAVADHTKDSAYRPVADAGALYGKINEGLDKSFDKVPAVKMRPILFDPMDKILHETMDAGKKVLNGTYDLLTLKKFRK